MPSGLIIPWERGTNKLLKSIPVIKEPLPLDIKGMANHCQGPEKILIFHMHIHLFKYIDLLLSSWEMFKRFCKKSVKQGHQVIGDE